MTTVGGKRVAVQGASGRVGSAIVNLLAPFYDVIARDVLDIPGDLLTPEGRAGVFAVINAAPYYTSLPLAEAAVKFGVHYLDMTEDVEVTDQLRELGDVSTHALIPQCGLAPGVISIIGGHMARSFEKLDTLKLRVGALPRHPSNRLGYALTWNTDGLINQYHGWADVIRDGVRCKVPPLIDVEELRVEGDTFEAFTTAGGVGTLCESFPDARTLNYKTIRYPGHAKLMRFLIEDMALDRIELKRILEKALPTIEQDVVLIVLTATGLDKDGIHRATTYCKTIMGAPGRTALQATTAQSTCAVLDLLAEKSIKIRGFVKQEEIPLEKFIANRYGRAFA